MSGIQSTGPNSNLGGTSPLSRAIRLPQSPSLRPLSPASGASGLRPADSVSLSSGLAGVAALERSVQQAQARVDDLDRVGALLDELRVLAADAGRSQNSSQIAEVQSRIDSIIGTIGDAEAASVNRFNPTSGPLGLGYEIQILPPGGATNATGFAKFAPGQTHIDVEVQILTSAQQGGFYLSLGASNLNLTGGTGFTIEIAGSKGVRMFTFVSGTTTHSIAQAINQFSAQTGVVAKQSDGYGYLPTGLQLRSSEFGDDAFVSVRVLSSGGIEFAPGHALNTGIYKFIENSSNTADTSPGSRTAFWQAYDGLTDYGQDVDALINGVQAQVKGNRLNAAGDNWRIAFDLDPYISQLRPEPFTPLRFVNTALREQDTATPQQTLDTFAQDLAARRAEATARLESARQQLRSALETITSADSGPPHLQTLADLRASLLKPKSN